MHLLIMTKSFKSVCYFSFKEIVLSMLVNMEIGFTVKHFVKSSRIFDQLVLVQIIADMRTLPVTLFFSIQLINL